MAADGVSTSARSRRRLGINRRTVGEAGRGERAAALFAGAGGVDARSVGAGAARADRGVAGDQGAAGDGDPARRLRLRGLGRSGPQAARGAAAAARSGRRSGRAIGRGRCCRSIGPRCRPGRRIAGRERRVYALVCSLPFSGAATAHFSFDMTIESFLEGHVRAFEWLGGVPRECVYDNLRSAVAARARRRRRDVITGTRASRSCAATTPFTRTPARRRRRARRARSRARSATSRPGSGRRGASRTLGELDDALRRLARPGRAAAPARDRPPHRRRAARARARAAAAAAAGRASTRPGAARRGSRSTAI